MPYIIAVLALVILGTGYTLFQKSPSEASTDVSVPETVTTTPTALATPTDSYDDSDGRVDDDKKDEDYDDNPSASDINEQASAVKDTVSPTPPPVADSSTYSDGTYYATKSYRTPDGTYEMSVSVTVKDDKVTASTLSFDADGAHSGYSKRFSSGYQDQLIGKDLGSVSLSRVGGASLTTNAFNSALSSIKSQAS